MIERLRAALLAADYTHDGVIGRVGSTAHDALGRSETVPAFRATADGSPLATMIRLWLLQRAVPAADAERALPGLVDPLCRLGVLRRTVAEVAAVVDIRPYQADDRHLWIASDLTPGLDGRPIRVGAEHVLGISPAALSLAALTVRQEQRTALDLGTGCGVQALHLAAHTGRVVATDVNQRALWLTGLNAGLNNLEVETRSGDLFAPVAGERFDQIVTNPPFVISPGIGERLVYRDSGLPGDQIVERIVRGLPDHLDDGGYGHVLANWMIVRDRPWDERLAEWLPDSCDAWVVQREVLDVAQYVELWLKDAGVHGGPDYLDRYDTWLSWFADHDVTGIGFGWINLHRTGGHEHRLEEWRWEVGQPLAGEVADHFARTEQVRRIDRVGVLRPVRRADVEQETIGLPGAADPATIVLRQQRGMRRARQVTTREAALVGACDGDLTIDQITAALDQILGEDEAAADATFVTDLVREGFLSLE